MSAEKVPQLLDVPLASLAELAIECWRLERWLNAQEQTAATSHGRHAARRLNRFLSERELTVTDITGEKYEPGLAVEVLDALDDESLPEGVAFIDETVSPIVMWRGTVVRFGQVVVRRRAGGSKTPGQT